MHKTVFVSPIGKYLDEFISMKRSIGYKGVQALLAQPNQFTFRGLRDLALLSVMYDFGARVQEIADLYVCNVRLEYPATLKLTGKGQKQDLYQLWSPQQIY